ncbi:hypothetical protein [Streptomyces sp. NPDC056401]|uniref:hypothetical protein n=1 Tax=Streptomyces sp. NPDC056401 TaxID=3345809 RepID=UPI0035E15D84
MLLRPAGAAGCLPTSFTLPENRLNVRLTALPDGSVHLSWLDTSARTDVKVRTAMLAPGAAERDPRNVGDVSLAVANDGTALVSWGGVLVERDGVRVRRYQTMEKAGGAAQWSAPGDLALAGAPEAVQLYAHPKGGFRMLWNGKDHGGLSYARRAAGAAAWGAAEPVGSGDALHLNAPVDLPNGDVFLAGSNGKPWYAVRSEAKGTWAAGRRFPSSYAVYDTLHSVLAANGTVVVAWSQKSGDGYLAKVSTFAGGTWSAPTTLSDPARGSHDWGFELTLDAQGRPLVSFGQNEKAADGTWPPRCCPSGT